MVLEEMLKPLRTTYSSTTCRKSSPGFPCLTTQGFQQVFRLAYTSQPDIVASSEKTVSGSWKGASHWPPEASLSAWWFVFCSRVQVPLHYSHSMSVLSISNPADFVSAGPEDSNRASTEVDSPVQKEEEDGLRTIRVGERGSM